MMASRFCSFPFIFVISTILSTLLLGSAAYLSIREYIFFVDDEATELLSLSVAYALVFERFRIASKHLRTVCRPIAL